MKWNVGWWKKFDYKTRIDPQAMAEMSEQALILTAMNFNPEEYKLSHVCSSDDFQNTDLDRKDGEK